eukprot:1065854-Alexandrium_andersonii.AAC.1
MSASLVGSEMCIRDRLTNALPQPLTTLLRPTNVGVCVPCVATLPREFDDARFQLPITLMLRSGANT